MTTTDAYAWIGGSGGSWGSAANWQDATSGQSPATAVPGSGNAVTITGPTGSVYKVIDGGGAAASLALSGYVDLIGSYAVGTLTVGASGSLSGLALAGGSQLSTTGAATLTDNASLSVGGSGTTATFGDGLTLGDTGGNAYSVLDQGAVLVTSGAGVSVTGTLDETQGLISVAGSGSVLTVSGTATIGAISYASNFLSYPDPSLEVASGGSVQLGALLLQNDFLSSPYEALYYIPNIYVDSASTLEVGSAGSAAAGAITVDADNSIIATSSAELNSNVVDNGTISETGGTLTIAGSLTGSGEVQIGANAMLLMDGTAGVGTTIALTGGNATPSIGAASKYAYNPSIGTYGYIYTPYAISATLSGFVSGDAITVADTTITNVVYSYAGNNTGSLTLFDGSTVVETLTLAGDYSGETFLAAPTTGQGSAITMVMEPIETIVPVSETVLAGINTTLAGFSVSDPDSQVTGLTVTLTDTLGQLFASTIGGGTVTGSGSETLSISGTVGQVNADLATLSYLADGSGTDAITVTSVDSLGSTAQQASVPVTVLAIAPPTITAPDGIVVARQGVAKGLAQISVADPDSVVPGEMITVTVSDFIGRLSVAAATPGGGGTVTGSGSTRLVIEGTLQQVDADLATLTYKSGKPGSDNVTVGASGTHGGSAADQVFTVVTPVSRTSTLYGGSYATITVAVDTEVAGTGTITGAARVAGTLESAGGLLILQGGATGPGTLRVDAASKMVLEGITSVGTITVDGTLMLDGRTYAADAFDVAAGGLVTGLGTIIANVANAGTVESNGGLLVLADGVTGAGTLLADVNSKFMLDRNASASAIVDRGTLVLGGGTVTAPTMTVSAGARLVGLGTITDAVANAGTIESSGGLLVLAGGVTGHGTLLIDAGSKMALVANTAARTIIVDGTLAVVGYTEAGSTSVAAGGRLVGSGSAVVVSNDETIKSSVCVQLVSGAAAGNGTMLVDAGSTLELLANTAGGTLLDNGLFLLDGVAAAVNSAIVAAGGRIAGFGSFLSPLTDNGVVAASSGLLKVGAVSGSGRLQIGNGATLELTTATSLDASFAPAAVGSLALDAPGNFYGVIAGLALDDTLTFKNEIVQSARLSGSTLAVVCSAGTADLNVAGALAGNHFAVSPDGHTLTLMVGAGV